MRIMKKVTLADVAKKAEVSKTTVSNFINKKYDNMSEATKKKIRKVIKELNYVPSIGAQGMYRKTPNKIICLIIPRNKDYILDNVFFKYAIKGITDFTNKTDFRTMIFTTNKRKKSDIDYVKGLNKGLVDGFILFQVESNDMYIKELNEDKIPFMAVGKYTSEEGKYVDINNIKGIEAATEHLINHGHQRIALFNVLSSLIVNEQNFKGYQRAHEKHNLKIDKKLIKEGAVDFNTGYRQMNELLKLKKKPTAVISDVDRIPGIVKVLNEKKLQVPRDVAILGITGHDNPYKYDFELSYIKYPAFEIGYEVTKNLTRMIYSKKEKKNYAKILNAELILRESCGCVEKKSEILAS